MSVTRAKDISFDDAEPDDVILGINQPAPFYGVLVSEPRYKDYSKAMQIAEMYELQEEKDESDYAFEDCTKKNIYLSSFTALVVGLIIGHATGSK
jgi:hypothetical protein